MDTAYRHTYPQRVYDVLATSMRLKVNCIDLGQAGSYAYAMDQRQRKDYQKQYTNQSGYTVLELLVVVLIIAVLITVLLWL